MPSKQPIPQSTKDAQHAEDRILDVLRGLIYHGSSPTFAELAKACGFRSRNSIRWYLDKAKERGRVTWDPRRTRSLRVL